LSIIGGSSGVTAQIHVACAEVRFNGDLTASPPAAVLDLDGENGLTIADLAVLLGDFFAHPTPPDCAQRSDYDCVQSGCHQDVGVSDLSIWLGAFFGQGAVYGVPLCGP
jgi:hypothetical protein